MTVISDLELPHFDYTDPELRGDRFHERMRELRAESWIARSDLGFVVLDREAANFFLKSKSVEFPGVMMFELLGITEGPLYESLSKNIITLNGEQHRRLRALVRDEFTPKAADRYRPAMRKFLAELFEPIAAAGRCDFVTAFAKPYPALMIATVVGAPLEDAPRLHELSNLLQSQFDAIAVMTRRRSSSRPRSSSTSTHGRSSRSAARTRRTTWCHAWCRSSARAIDWRRKSACTSCWT